MKYLFSLILSLVVMAICAMQGDDEYKKASLNMNEFTQIYINNPEKVEEFKKSISSLYLWDLIKHENTYIKGQRDLNTANINVLPEPMQKGIKQSKIWCAHVLPIIQTIKQEKIRNYLFYGGGIIGLCIACCTLCYWLDHNNDSERQIIQFQIEY